MLLVSDLPWHIAYQRVLPAYQRPLHICFSTAYSGGQAPSSVNVLASDFSGNGVICKDRLNNF
jgi:hypothetical protein